MKPFFTAITVCILLGFTGVAQALDCEYNHFCSTDVFQGDSLKIQITNIPRGTHPCAFFLAAHNGAEVDIIHMYTGPDVGIYFPYPDTLPINGTVSSFSDGGFFSFELKNPGKPDVPAEVTVGCGGGTK